MSVREKFKTVLWVAWTLIMLRIVDPAVEDMKYIWGHTVLRRIFITSIIIAVVVSLLFFTGIVRIRFVPNYAY